MRERHATSIAESGKARLICWNPTLTLHHIGCPFYPSNRSLTQCEWLTTAAATNTVPSTFPSVAAPAIDSNHDAGQLARCAAARKQIPDTPIRLSLDAAPPAARIVSALIAPSLRRTYRGTARCDLGL
jgi:hypothetical protein